MIQEWRAKLGSSYWVIAAGLAVSLLNVLFLLTEQYWGLLLPFAIAGVVLLVLALDKVLLFLAFATPLSLFYFNEKLHLGASLPTEPILLGLLILFIGRLLYDGRFDARVLRHPLTLAILFYLLWMGISTFTSRLPGISAKYLLAQMWFVAVFYLLYSQLYRTRKYIFTSLWLYLVPLAAVVLYTVIRHASYGFTHFASGWVMTPFFKEHTSYGAALALYLPVSVLFIVMPRFNLNRKLIGVLLTLVLLVGVILSYTRAAWVSLAIAGLVGLFLYLKISDWVFYALAAVFLGGLVYFQDDLREVFQENESTSSDNLTEHVESISNITTDASNLERINRWKSAFRMFSEKPLVGHGPGTYMFLYAPYQKPYEKTIISTNAGDLGNAHSEYIGPLAETGVPGTLSVLLIVYLTITTGVRVYRRMEDPQLRLLALALLMGLVTYWVHGLLNNFLTMDKLALPVWSFTAALVVLDVHFRREEGSS